MNEFMEGNRIQRTEGPGGIGYLLDAEDLFNSTDYRILQNQKDGALLPCVRMKYNGKTQLLMLTREMRPMSEVLYRMPQNSMVAVSISLMRAVLGIRNNGFLNPACLDLDWDHIYVESGTWKACLAYVPVYTQHRPSMSELSGELMSGLALLLEQRPENSSGTILSGFLAELKDPALSMESICRRRIAGMEMEDEDEPVRKLSAGGGMGGFEVIIDRDDMVLGRAGSDEKGGIPFNRRISRRHCRITRVNGKCYVRDLGSVNGTSVNHVYLKPGEVCLLKKGDVLSLADSDFEVM